MEKIILISIKEAAKIILSNKKSVIDINDSFPHINLGKHIKNYVTSNMDSSFTSLVFLCIGTDRSTGDSLGPMVGYKLSHLNYKNIWVHGNLENPVHAKNLNEKVDEIHSLYTRPFIVAIDACLGNYQNIGHINISEGPIYPGAGVNKNLLPVGNIHITGTVNSGGYMEYFVLQNTRLNIVMKMADIIKGGIMNCIEDLYLQLQCNNMYTAKKESLVNYVSNQDLF
ncbi:spore protease YyaC [Oxobacter pfennigii]|uniref:spore protease YyaC n=1 Tax=Oxobacter pfennigii TaxID=36849 RepID=UPI001FA75A0D|nr:spore protease YyaC [Oxobacter pfennigii]